MLEGKVCVVTGASRGVGRGTALGLARAGATVYVTGRTTHSQGNPLPGTIYETAEAVNRAGGKGIPVVCDHGDDEQVKRLFAQVASEQNRLDLLVNCAIAIPAELTHVGPFWEKPLTLTALFGVGMRSTYVASYYAAPLLIRSGGGLIVNISSAGGRCYMHGPAYGASKAATDKMSFDMAHDFRSYGVDVVTLWPGLVKTERTMAVCNAEPDKYGEWIEHGESPEFQGLLIGALFADPARHTRSGKVFYGAELAQDYGLVDINGKAPPSHRPMLGDPPEFSSAVVE